MLDCVSIRYAPYTAVYVPRHGVVCARDSIVRISDGLLNGVPKKENEAWMEKTKKSTLK